MKPMERMERMKRLVLLLVMTFLICEPAAAYQQIWKDGKLASVSEGNASVFRLSSSGKHTPSLIVSKIQPISFASNFLKIRLRAENVTPLAGIEVRAYSGAKLADFFYWTVPIYEDPSFNLLQGGEWLNFTVSLGNAKQKGHPDATKISQIGLWVIDKGKSPVVLDAMLPQLLPKPNAGVVSLTFDDGYQEQFSLAANTMAGLHMPGTAYVMPDQIGTPHYLSIDNLKDMKKYGWEIAAHHALPFTEIADLPAEIVKIQDFLRPFGDGREHLAYPLGKQTPPIRKLVNEKFLTARIAGAGPETLPPCDWHLLRAVNVVHGNSVDELMRYVKMATDDKMWVIFMFHHLSDAQTEDTYYPPGKFVEFLGRLKTSGVQVETVAEIYNKYHIEK